MDPQQRIAISKSSGSTQSENKLTSNLDWTLVKFSVDLVYQNWLDGFRFVGLIEQIGFGSKLFTSETLYVVVVDFILYIQFCCFDWQIWFGIFDSVQSKQMQLSRFGLVN